MRGQIWEPIDTEPALQQDIARCQRLLREDIVDKALKRDMTAFYKVRRVLELERLFLYLCYHDGGILDVQTISQQLDGVNKQTVVNFLDLFEATHLVYRLKPYGYGKEVLRGRDKVYLADAALPGAVTLQGRKLLERPDRLGAAVETAFFKHVFTRYYSQAPRFSYWKGPKDEEVDLIAEAPDRAVPFEVKYQVTEIAGNKLKGLRRFLEKYDIEQGYVITQRSQDFGVLELTSAEKGRERERLKAQVMAIPAPLACYWLSEDFRWEDQLSYFVRSAGDRGWSSTLPALPLPVQRPPAPVWTAPKLNHFPADEAKGRR